MTTLTSIFYMGLAAAITIACSSSPDTTTTDKSGTSPDKSAPSASCQSGQTNVASRWYAVPECQTYFDTVRKCTCATRNDKSACETQFASGLASSLCYPASLTFSEETAKSACVQALSSYKQIDQKCL